LVLSNWRCLNQLNAPLAWLVSFSLVIPAFVKSQTSMYLQTLSLGWRRRPIISLNLSHLVLNGRLLAIMGNEEVFSLRLIITWIRSIRLLAMLAIDINILILIFIFFHFMN